ncbi:MAG TPA: hypothetical protein VMV79_01090, partial [Alphaproteobacteria bacterium]|nr:hypothetical protein [Alphaproteobacteria bacterium]
MAAANRINHAAVAFWCFAMSVAWLPIGLGGDRPVPLGLAQAGLALSCLFLFLEPKNLSRTPFFPRLRWALGLLAAVAVWAWLQTQSFMPAAWVHPVWQEASEVLKTPLAGTIAVSPEDALYGLSRFITCIAAGLLAYTLGQDTHRARQFVQALWLTGVVICAYGLLVQITGSHKILWLDKWIFSNDLTATFINRDDFALYAGIVLVCGVALLAQSWQEDVLAKRIHRRPVAIKEWLMRHGITEVFMLALVVTSIVLSHS